MTRQFGAFPGRQRKLIFLSTQKGNTENHRTGRHLEISAHLPIAYSKISSAQSSPDSLAVLSWRRTCSLVGERLPEGLWTGDSETVHSENWEISTCSTISDLWRVFNCFGLSACFSGIPVLTFGTLWVWGLASWRNGMHDTAVCKYQLP